MRKKLDIFTTIKTEGGLLPPDLLQRVSSGENNLPGLKPGDYHLAAGEKLNEAIARSWNRLLGVWTSFQTQAKRLPEDDVGTSITRERWLLILFQELGYGRLQAGKSIEIEGKSYPIGWTWTAGPRASSARPGPAPTAWSRSF